MSTNRKPSSILGRMVTVDLERRCVTTYDGVVYSRAELVALKGAPAALIVAVHAAKRVFGGVVVESRELAQ